MAKKNVLKIAPNLFMGLANSDKMNELKNSEGYIVVYGYLQDPSAWTEDVDYVIEYNPVAIHRIVPAVPSKFIKEIK